MTQQHRRGIGRTEWMIGGAVVGVLLLLAIPFALSSGGGERDEVPLIVEEIRKFENVHHAAFDEFVSVEPTPRTPHELNGEAVPWRTNAGLEKIGFSLEQHLGRTEVVGSYKVVATDKGFTITGTSDIDGDGIRATFVATESEPVKMTTPDDVY